MRISDWSSDVCSSDLRRRHPIRPSVCAGPNRRLPRGRPIPEAFPMDSSMLKFIFGRLTLDALPLHEPILVATFAVRSEEHTSVLQSLMRISYAVFCLKKKKHTTYDT